MCHPAGSTTLDRIVWDTSPSFCQSSRAYVMPLSPISWCSFWHWGRLGLTLKASQQFCPGFSWNILSKKCAQKQFLAFFILRPFFSISSVWLIQYYTLINRVGGQCRNILPAAFSVLTDRREAKGNIFLHWPTNSVNKSFLALQSKKLHWKNRPYTTELASWIFLWAHFHFAGPWRLNFIFHESWNWNILLKLMFTPPRQQ